MYWEEGCYQLVAGASPVERGLGSSNGRSPQIWGWIRLLIVPLQNISNYCTVFIGDPPFGAALARVGLVF